MEFLVRGHIARAAWLRATGVHGLALDDLTKALDLAERSGMRLLHADELIERARLALAMGAAPAAAGFVVQARKVIDSTFVDHSAEPPQRTDIGYAKRDVDLHLVEAAICLADDPESAAQALAKAAALVEAGYWGSLDELADLYARSGLDDGGAIARLTAARADFDEAADAAFDAARKDYLFDHEIDARLADPDFCELLIKVLRDNGHDFAQMPVEAKRLAARELIGLMRKSSAAAPGGDEGQGGGGEEGRAARDAVDALIANTEARVALEGMLADCEVRAAIAEQLEKMGAPVKLDDLPPEVQLKLAAGLMLAMQQAEEKGEEGA